MHGILGPTFLLDRREVLSQLGGKKVQELAPKLKVDFEPLIQEKAMMEVEFVDGTKQTFHAAGLTYSDLSRDMFEQCRAI